MAVKASSVCYAVPDWHKHFENAESRKYKSLTWVPMKNKHDGKGYRRVSRNPKSIQVFCAWCLIVQVASKMPVRGILHDDDGPLTASDLSDKTDFPASIFELAFKVLVEEHIGWLVSYQPNDLLPLFEEAFNASKDRSEKDIGDERIGWLIQRYSRGVRTSPETPESKSMNRMEQNGTEQNEHFYSTCSKDRGAGKGAKERGNGEHRTRNSELRTLKGGDEHSTLNIPRSTSIGGNGGGHRPHATANQKLTFGDVGRVAGEIMGNDWQWCYDNCRVKLTDFTLAGLQTVLRPFVNLAAEKQIRAAWCEAVLEAHQQSVDFQGRDPVKSPAALATQKFREKMNHCLTAENA
jgi:hypothetical protein